MARKTLGYAELQWACPNCGGINAGLQKTCAQCGAPQPEDVSFEQAQGEELRQDEDIKARVQAGPDIHCPYCEARNRGDAQACSQCGGDLTEGARRKSGQILGAYRDGPVEEMVCPRCGAENPGTARACSQCGGGLQPSNDLSPQKAEAGAGEASPAAKPKIPILLAFFLAGLCILAGVFIFLSLQTDTLAGTVQGVHWQRSIVIEEWEPVEYQDWENQVPAEATIQSCQQELRSVESEPQVGAVEVCGTPYSIDTGSGVAEVVQDCEYQIYDDYCTYTIFEWVEVDSVTLSGEDFHPQWPDPILSAEQRLGERAERYTVLFETSRGVLDYNLMDYNAFQRFQIGTQWNLEVNALGAVVSVEQ